MGAASSVQNDVHVRYEDFDSLKFCAEIPNCSEKTLAIYACKFPTVIDDRMLRYIVGKLRDDEPYRDVMFTILTLGSEFYKNICCQKK